MTQARVRRTVEATHKTAAVLVPAQRVWGPIQAIRTRHDRQVRRWMPHITLLYPFVTPTELARAAERLALVCSRTAPFEVALRDFGLFEHRSGRCTLWLDPVPREPVVALQRALREALPECAHDGRMSDEFRPHLSVGQARGRAEAADLRRVLRAHWQPIRFTVDAVSLLWREDPPDDVFRVDRRVRLGPPSKAAPTRSAGP